MLIIKKWNGNLELKPGVKNRVNYAVMSHTILNYICDYLPTFRELRLAILNLAHNLQINCQHLYVKFFFI